MDTVRIDRSGEAAMRVHRASRRSTVVSTALAFVLATLLAGCGGSSSDPLPATQDTVDAILPDLATMEDTPYEVEPARLDDHDDPVCDEFPDACGDRPRASGAADFYHDAESSDVDDSTGGVDDGISGDTDENGQFEEGPDGSELVVFYVVVHASESDAERTFAGLRDVLDDDSMWLGSAERQSVGDESVGDEFAGYTLSYEGFHRGIASLVRNGGYVTLILQTATEPHLAPDSDTQRLNTLMARRMTEAWSGDTPRTTLREAQSDEGFPAWLSRSGGQAVARPSAPGP